ncbi:MAG: hypothetical protein FJX93_00800 [Bacteroidetes bacterium]|nr:hypothetical protein [Bacteroidota bacterium]
MSPGPRRDRLEAYMGMAVAAGTPWFAWSYLLATYPALPPVAELDSDLWAYLLNRVLGISVVLEGIYLTLAIALKRYRMAFNIVVISVVYLAAAIYWRWEWL